MRIFQIKNYVDGFATINFGDIDMMNVLKTGNVSVLDGKHFLWNKTIGDSISDCPFFIGAMPIFTSQKLGETLAATSCNTATFEVEGIKYTIVAASPVHGKVINQEKSKCRSFRSGKIMEVSDYVFSNNESFNNLFTLEEYMMHTFCSLEIAKLLQACKFENLILKECPVI